MRAIAQPTTQGLFGLPLPSLPFGLPGLPDLPDFLPDFGGDASKPGTPCPGQPSASEVRRALDRAPDQLVAEVEAFSARSYREAPERRRRAVGPWRGRQSLYDLADEWPRWALGGSDCKVTSAWGREYNSAFRRLMQHATAPAPTRGPTNDLAPGSSAAGGGVDVATVAILAVGGLVAARLLDLI